jgi:hypothetical protein
MGVLFAIIGLILTMFTFFYLEKNIILNKKSIIKKAKVIGFESYTYLMPGTEYNTVYNANLYPILEVEDDDKKVKIALSYLSNKINLERGDEIEVIYPKGKIEKLKLYDNESKYRFYYLIITIGIIVTLLSITML